MGFLKNINWKVVPRIDVKEKKQRNKIENFI